MATKVSDVYQKAYVSVERWPKDDQEHVITDVDVDVDPFNKEADGQLIYLCFDNQEPRYRVNKMNAQTLASAFGEEIRKWKGKKVVIRKEKAIIRGKPGFQGIIEPAPRGK